MAVEIDIQLRRVNPPPGGVEFVESFSEHKCRIPGTWVARQSAYGYKIKVTAELPDRPGEIPSSNCSSLATRRLRGQTTVHPSAMAKTVSQESLVSHVTAYVEKFMGHYDGSHDFSHVLRVLGLALTIAASSTGTYDLHVVALSALLLDVGDKKYRQPGDDAKTMVQNVLLSFGADENLASKVQTICSGVPYSSEISDPALAQTLIAEYPELAAVQDADRLDAIGAVGIGRTFTFGGAKGGRAMGDTMKIFRDKLGKLEGMMKTEKGREMARERTERLKIFKGWWEDEQKSTRRGLGDLGGNVDVDVDGEY